MNKVRPLNGNVVLLGGRELALLHLAHVPGTLRRGDVNPYTNKIPTISWLT